MRLAVISEMGGDALNEHCDSLFDRGPLNRQEPERLAWHVAIHYCKEMALTATVAGLTPAAKAAQKPCEWKFTYDEKRRLASLRNACSIAQRQVMTSRFSVDPFDHSPEGKGCMRAFQAAVKHLAILVDELKRERQHAYNRAVERGQL